MSASEPASRTANPAGGQFISAPPLPPPPRQLSALQGLLHKSSAENNGHGSGTTTTTTTHAAHLENLALQIKHNLQHQHQWTSLRIHRHHHHHHRQHEQQNDAASPLPLPRPLISGLPPQRLYMHPDEQIALLQAQKEAGGTGLGKVLPQREWVLPSQLREKWSLRRFGDVFDCIGVEPPRPGPEEGDEEEDEEDEDEDEERGSEWRTTKRLLLATLDDDSTIVYYIVHDGIVKPRQN